MDRVEPRRQATNEFPLQIGKLPGDPGDYPSDEGQIPDVVNRTGITNNQVPVGSFCRL